MGIVALLLEGLLAITLVLIVSRVVLPNKAKRGVDANEGGSPRRDRVGGIILGIVSVALLSVIPFNSLYLHKDKVAQNYAASFTQTIHDIATKAKTNPHGNIILTTSAGVWVAKDDSRILGGGVLPQGVSLSGHIAVDDSYCVNVKSDNFGSNWVVSSTASKVKNGACPAYSLASNKATPAAEMLADVNMKIDLLAVQIGVNQAISGWRGVPPGNVPLTFVAPKWSIIYKTTTIASGTAAIGDILSGKIWTDGSYCIQSVNPKALHTWILRSDTGQISAGSCPMVALGGVGTIP